MKKLGALTLMVAFLMGFSGIANANLFGPKGTGWHPDELEWGTAAGVGIQHLMDSNFFGAYSVIDDYEFLARYDFTAIAHESGNFNVILAGEHPENGGESMETVFSTGPYDNWGDWYTVDFGGGQNLKFSDLGDGNPNTLLNPFKPLSGEKYWASDYFKLFMLEEDSKALTWLEGNPVLSAGTIIAGWNDNRPRTDKFIDSDFDDLIIAVKPVPEPGTILLLGLGLMGMAGVQRKIMKQ